MNRDILDKAVVETLGFNPTEMKYKMLELQTEITELKQALHRMAPIIGTGLAELQVLKDFLAYKKLDPQPFIEMEMRKLLQASSEEQKALEEQVEEIAQAPSPKKKITIPKKKGH